MEFKRKVLKNGMTILFEKRDVPVVSVAFAVRSGGINETPKEKGISHFIEHMLYKGTSTRDYKKIAEEIENNGGELNGFTVEELTAYWCKMPAKHLNIALEVMGDMIKNPLFDKREFEKERKVIFEEIKMYHDNPRMYTIEEIQASLYTGTMQINLAGTFETMNSITREDLVKKFKEVYTPNNLILCVVGNADFNEVVNFAEENFEKRNGKVPEVKFSEKNESRIEERIGVDQANMIFAFHIPKAGDEKSYAAIVLNSIMAGGISSRLFMEIREKQNLAYSVHGDANINKRYAYNLVFVGTMKENVDKVKKIILDEFGKVSQDLTEEELKIVKERLIGNYEISMEDSQGQMVNLLGSEIQGNAEEYYKFEEKIFNVKLKDVKELAKKATQKYSFFALVPK